MQFGLLRDYNPYLFLNEDSEFKSVENLRKKEAEEMLQLKGNVYNINIIPDEKKYLTDEDVDFNDD